MRDFLPIDERDVGWITLAAIAVITIIKYGPTWIRAFTESGNVAHANELTAIRIQMDSLQKELSRKEEVIQSLVSQQHYCKEEVARLEKELRQMRKDYDDAVRK